jgi:hypothetical protein
MEDIRKLEILKNSKGSVKKHKSFKKGWDKLLQSQDKYKNLMN